MIVTYKWLKEFVDFDLSAAELSHRLTMAGLEVDFMQEVGAGLDSVIVARLDSVDPHPQADRLTVCQVDNGTDVVQVVCGATNHKTGDLVALAQVSSVLPGDFKIKKSKIRGIESRGMLCSEKELGLTDESDGIMILPPGLELGLPVFEALDIKDVRYEIGLTPNRADCLSVLGIAREVAAFTGKALKVPQKPVFESTPENINDFTSIEIETPDGCPRYMARLIRGVKVGPSPDWLVHRLEAVGMRSINNIVDVTNYVLMELGHPLHAFDFNRLAGRKIIVKRAHDGFDFTTLDGQTHELNSEDVVVCDADEPVALAGVMGERTLRFRTIQLISCSRAHTLTLVLSGGRAKKPQSTPRLHIALNVVQILIWCLWPSIVLQISYARLPEPQYSNIPLTHILSQWRDAKFVSRYRVPMRCSG